MRVCESVHVIGQVCREQGIGSFSEFRKTGRTELVFLGAPEIAGSFGDFKKPGFSTDHVDEAVNGLVR